MNDQFGDRMKDYEGIETNNKFIPTLPVIVRLDGKCFSRLTKSLNRPYDERMAKLMIDVTKELVKETNAVIGYTQSDEISLVLYSDSYEVPIYFNGKSHKIISVLTSIATYWFNEYKHDFDFPDEMMDIPAFFDCRAWNVPTRTEAVNTLLWRELDALKNSVSVSARQFYTTKELVGVKRDQMMDMLMENGVNWNDYPAFFKRGTYIQKRVEPVDDVLPGLVRTDPPRFIVQELDLPPLTRVTNRTGVFFEKQEPIVNPSF